MVGKVGSVIFLVFFFSHFAHGSRGATPVEATEGELSTLYDALQEVRASFGKYPTTREGLKSLLVTKSKRKCFSKLIPGILRVVRYNMALTDGWNAKLKYTSDGKTYRVEASHGYFLTETSPDHHRTMHWDNPSPPPDIVPSPEPGNVY